MKITKIDSTREKYIHDLIIENNEIQKDLLSILNLKTDLSRLKLVHEDRYINGITADFTFVYNNSIEAIIECKAGDIGVTDYVRGIGQVLQYEYFYENNISPKGFSYSESFNSVLLIPSSVFKTNTFNIGKFKYPTSTLIVEINESSKVARKITKKELLELSTVNNDSLTSISQYYIRDNRLFEIFMLLRYLCFLKIKGMEKANRREVEVELMNTNTINNGNWRNAWISVSSFGFIDSNNMPTASGIKIGMLEYDDFLILIFKSYIKPYVELLITYFSKKEENLNKRYLDIISDIKLQFSNRDVLFLTQSKGRYLSSWLNILRDDFGCIKFESRSNKRKLIYNPLELNESAFKKKINSNTNAQEFLENLKNITK
jgi:hypothetical protein